MSEASFLPEDDQDFLRAKGLPYRLLSENVGEELRRAVEFLEFCMPPNLFRKEGSVFVPAAKASVLVLIPKGYSKTRLDSWYIKPGVFLANGQPAPNADSEQALFGSTWQFWSRHLADGEWREGLDSLETYLQYIRAGFRCA